MGVTALGFACRGWGSGPQCSCGFVPLVPIGDWNSRKKSQYMPSSKKAGFVLSFKNLFNMK